MNKLFARSRGLLVIVALAMIAAMFTVSTAGAALSPRDAAQAPPTGTFSFQNYNSNYCLGISGGEDNATAIQWDCNKAPDQTWHRGNEDGTSGYYQIINGDGECLGVYQISTTEGALVVGWQCLGTTHPDQYWAWDESSTDPGYYYLVDYNSGQVVGVLDNSKALGASIVQWPNQHTPNNQLWEASQAQAAAPPVTTIANGVWAGYSAYPDSNGVKLSRSRHQPELDHGQGRQPRGLAVLAGLVPPAWPLGLAGVAAARAVGHQVAGEGDLEGQVGEGVVKLRRGKRNPGR
jgi:hypothetical protein